ncbi:hypothetical protein N9C08_01690, partial [Rubripirellula sp.]|nr:hypothetical protein [Rubripirellula sp.]
MRRRNYREQQPKGITTQQKLHQRDDYMRRKASLDRIIGFLLLVFTSPLILLLAAIVKCTSKGPA